MMLHAPEGWGDRLNVKDNSMQKKKKANISRVITAQEPYVAWKETKKFLLHK